jgi:5-methylcytosine-specific restriction endonuclease McrA
MSKPRSTMTAAQLERVKAYDRQHYARTAESQRARHKAYYARERERVLAQKAARRKGPEGDAVRTLHREYQAKRYDSLPRVVAACKANAKAWRAANPRKRREYEMRRHAIKRATAIERVDYERIWRESDGVCGICKQHIRVYDEIHFDHVVPLSKGGTHTYNNIQVAHARCNMRKSDKVMEIAA